MTSYGGVFEFICAPENLRLAMLRAARGKRDWLSVAAFLANAGSELACLRGDLQDGRYDPRPYTQFRVMDPKPRTISCASFRDRVVHHALCGVIGPLIERRFITHCYACRVGKGTHKAVEKLNLCSRYQTATENRIYRALGVLKQLKTYEQS